MTVLVAGGRRRRVACAVRRRGCCAITVAAGFVLITGCADDGPTGRSVDDSGASSVASVPPVGSVSISGTVTSPSPTTEHPAPETTAAVDSGAGTSAGGSSRDGDEDVSAEAFTRSLFDEVDADVPGCTVAVGRDGDVVFAEAYGAARLDPLEPMTVDTLVDIGSVSKQFTATAILLLAERGAVDLDASLSTYLPDLPQWATQTTLTHLLHHQSGIPDYIGLLLRGGASLTAPSTIADAVAALGGVADLDFEPGSRWAYSNSNYFLLSQVVLAVDGRDLGSFLAAEVFDPLTLDMVMDPMLASDEEALSYERRRGEWRVAEARWESTIGAGSIHTTPSELVRWAAQYWEPTIGSPAINAERLDDAAAAGFGAEYGAGIAIFDDAELGEVLAHDGGWNGFVTFFAVAPELRLAAAATCTSPDGERDLPYELATLILGAWADA